jgi:hypothetical protein
MAHKIITERGWQGRAGREAAMDEIAHAFTQEVRAQEVKDGLDIMFRPALSIMALC